MRTLLLILLCSRACAEVPIFTVGTAGAASGLTSPTFYGMTNAVFAYRAAPVTTIAYHGSTYYTTTGITSDADVMPLVVSFKVNAQTFEFSVACPPNNMYFEMFDGTDFSPISGPITQNFLRKLVTVQFGSKADRNITLYLSGTDGGYFEGVNVASGDSITANTLPPQKLLAVIGDSYTEGYSSTDANSRWLGGFAMLFPQSCHNVQVLPSGVGGTGYVWPATGAKTNYQWRVTNDVIALNPDFLIITGGLNDYANSVATNTFYTACTNLFASVSSALPRTKIAVVGPWSKDSTASASATNFAVLCGAAAGVYGLRYINPIAQGWINAGNIGTYIGSDNVHPTLSGYSYFANRIRTNFPDWFNDPQVQGNVTISGNVTIQ